MKKFQSKQDTRCDDVAEKLTSWTSSKIDIIDQSKYDIYNFVRVTKGGVFNYIYKSFRTFNKKKKRK